MSDIITYNSIRTNQSDGPWPWPSNFKFGRRSYYEKRDGPFLLNLTFEITYSVQFADFKFKTEPTRESILSLYLLSRWFKIIKIFHGLGVCSKSYSQGLRCSLWFGVPHKQIDLRFIFEVKWYKSFYVIHIRVLWCGWP